MQAVEVRIPGQYWDSFIYNGRLYLFTLSGDIFSYNWDRLVESISTEADYKPLMWQFLAQGQAWYSPRLRKLLESPKIYQEIKILSNKITTHPYVLSAKNLQESLIDTAGSPSHPHTDVEAFYNTLYISSSSGVRAASLARKLSSGFQRLSDIPALRVACSYGSMAIAAGSEGMFDQTLTSSQYWPRTNKLRKLSSRNCVACSWSYFDVIGSSGPGDAGFIAAFAKPQKEETESGLSSITSSSRELLDIVESNDLFPFSDGLLFGAENILVMASQSSLYIDGWNPYLRRTDEGPDVQRSLFSQHNIEVNALTEEAIDGAATTFGIVVEMDSALLLRGIDETISGFGEPVNWRTFPRSHRYLNQLHVTYDDYIAIFAFIDDYFISDKERGPAVHRPQSRMK